MRLKNEPIAVNMSVLVKLVSKPSSASRPNSRGCDDRWTASAGKAQTCARSPVVTYPYWCRELRLRMQLLHRNKGRTTQAEHAGEPTRVVTAAAIVSRSQ